MKIVVTGGAGFIGSAFVRTAMAGQQHEIVTIDKLTYAGDPSTVASVAADPRYQFVKADICDGSRVASVLEDFRPDAIVHLAAESHVDRSIDRPADFVETNIVGTYSLLEVARRYWEKLAPAAKSAFRFVHVSTDEVFGSLAPDAPAFDETTGYDPRSPYAGSKAAADHLVRAWWHTYGLPTIISNCTNNFGPYQFPEKLIPLMIIKALAGEPLPIYGDGSNVRDWLFVDDHATALLAMLENGKPGDTYLLGGAAERTNLQVVETICDLVDALAPANADIGIGTSRRELIHYVTDRPGHDFRYAIDSSNAEKTLRWRRSGSFEALLENTVRWYLENAQWWQAIQQKSRYGGDRLGLSAAAGA